MLHFEHVYLHPSIHRQRSFKVLVYLMTRESLYCFLYLGGLALNSALSSIPQPLSPFCILTVSQLSSTWLGAFFPPFFLFQQAALAEQVLTEQWRGSVRG